MYFPIVPDPLKKDNFCDFWTKWGKPEHLEGTHACIGDKMQT